MKKLPTNNSDNNMEYKIMFWFTVVYLSFFSIVAIFNANFEFLYYSFVMAILMFIVLGYQKKFHLKNHILSGLALMGFLHVIGGNLHIGNTRLYDLWIIGPNILKYDNLTHAFGIFVITLIVYSLFEPYLNKNKNHVNNAIVCLLLVLIAMGTGAINEIIEFGAVIFLDAQRTVGDYFNNSMDLIFNLIGSLIACIFIIKHRKK